MAENAKFRSLWLRPILKSLPIACLLSASLTLGFNQAVDYHLKQQAESCDITKPDCQSFTATAYSHKAYFPTSLKELLPPHEQQVLVQQKREETPILYSPFIGNTDSFNSVCYESNISVLEQNEAGKWGYSDMKPLQKKTCSVQPIISKKMSP